MLAAVGGRVLQTPQHSKRATTKPAKVAFTRHVEASVHTLPDATSLWSESLKCNKGRTARIH